MTIGDFGAQALIIAAIKKNFPNDEVVGEEEASDLRSNKELSSKIWNLVKGVKLSDSEADALVGGPLKSEDVGTPILWLTGFNALTDPRSDRIVGNA